MYKKIIAAAFAVCVISSVQAYAEYSYPYNTDIGCFEIPYVTVTKDELQEPEYAVGELHENHYNKASIISMVILSAELPNGNTMKMSMPWTYYHIGWADYEFKKSDSNIYVYDNNGALVIQKDLEDNLESGVSTQYKPVIYKGNWFIECNGGVYQIDPYTFEVERRLTKTSFSSKIGLYPFETDQKTIFESNGGYEMIPENFVRNIGYCTPNSMYSFYPRYIYIYEEQKTIEYSCDGIYYINIMNPLDKAGQMVHYLVNGEDCLCIACDDQYYAYKISDLKQCWTEYTENAPYVYLNGVRLAFDTPPVIENGITMMPLRYLLETAGATVDWEEESKSAIITYNDTEIKITENENVAYINGRTVPLSTTPRIINEKMMIPLRFISEELGFSVEWEQDTRSIHIKTKIDNINTFVSVLSPVEIRDNGTVLNGEPIKTVIAGGRTFIPIEFLKKHFSVSKVSDSDSEHYELALLTEPDNSVDLTEYDFYSRSTDMVCIHRYSSSAKLNDICIPTYITRSNIDGTTGNTAELLPFDDEGFICIEEAADRLDCLHYEWIEEEHILHVYISDDMVTYDDVLKAILDKKGIAYNESYNGDYFKDIDAMQKYSQNHLSELVQAGIKAGIIRETDYPDGHLRPTRNISHIDLNRMLKGIGYEYSYKQEDANIPITQEELEYVLKNL